MASTGRNLDPAWADFDRSAHFVWFLCILIWATDSWLKSCKTCLLPEMSEWWLNDKKNLFFISWNYFISLSFHFMEKTRIVKTVLNTFLPTLLPLEVTKNVLSEPKKFESNKKQMRDMQLCKGRKTQWDATLTTSPSSAPCVWRT